MHRLLVETRLLNEESPALPADAAKHLKVLRPKPGEEIELFDGKGAWRVYKVVVGSGSGRTDFRLVPSGLPSSCLTSRLPNSIQRPKPLTLFACVTKGSRWDWTVEKATELGVTRIVPVISERTIVRIAKEDRAAKRERWMRIAEDAARQSDAKWLPEILEPLDFADSLPLVRETRCFVGALTNPPPRMILDELCHSPTPTTNSNHAIFVGPEGDFTPEELASLIEIATPVSFGPTVLRAETAAIFGVSVLASFLAARDAAGLI